MVADSSSKMVFPTSKEKRRGKSLIRRLATDVKHILAHKN